MTDAHSPPTAALHYTPYRAVRLQSDEKQVLRPFMVILRHRYLRRQHVIVPAASGRASAAVARPTPGIPVDTLLSAGAHRGRDGRDAEVNNEAHDVSQPESGNPTGSSTVERQLPAATQQPQNGSCPSVPLAEAQSSGSRVEEGPAIGSGRMTSSEVKITRHGLKIRGRQDQTVWFSSRGTTYILEPKDVPARFGDLYVHTTSNFDQQIWLCDRDLTWHKVTLLHPHPYIAGYVLHMVSNGEPRWVKSATIRTYDGRRKKADREARTAAGTSSSSAMEAGSSSETARGAQEKRAGQRS
ncbi:hypothetical protein PYCCODRAFT_1429094 [Trametes coccinea BRFM310]|uniref:Uncharacterized protein n=1 Tax=Trametes coccinea (strain BRFM310) TaxID=1353009 RepID=A0A1Y2I5N2_TRAC3|nr:hypothetical protein PYCCODRAFT_1429094 [Trametes coccinea BRFM310]